jgi:cardiolipin synthase C
MRFLQITPWLALLLLPACAQLPPRPVLPFQAAPAVGSDSALDQILGPVEALHPDSSGFRLMSQGPEAFAVRAHACQLAGRSLDVQTYIWHADLVGRYLAQLLLDAADRGVKVRLLLDDLDARAKNYGFAALSAHPNIEVRMFNPLASRRGKLRSIGEFMTNGKQLNYRMHNKSWIVDNRLAIVGGRNVGDEYFGASDTVNFVDLDFVMVGPIVRDISAAFDRYWNSSIVYPLETLSPDGVNAAALEKLRASLAPVLEEGKQSQFAAVLQNNDAVRRFISGDWPAIWSSHYLFVADEPIKAARGRGAQASEVLGALAPALSGAQHSLTLISPYFVPGKSATAVLTKEAQHGRQVRILTNSLAATDVAAVHGGYAKYRKPLLEGGVSLWEMKPLFGSGATSSLTGSKGASLHTKALSIDDRQLFVGSYNLDPRSTSLNTEQGVLVMNAELAAQFAAIFSEETSPPRSWKVTLSGGRLSWTDGSDTFVSEPKASAWRRFQAWLAGVLPVEKQL